MVNAKYKTKLRIHVYEIKGIPVLFTAENFGFIRTIFANLRSFIYYRELSKVLDQPTKQAYKELKRNIKFVLDTKYKALILNPVGDFNLKQIIWNVLAFSDSDFAGDPDTRRSITGFILFFMGVAISWKSKSQKSCSLSSTEAELYALSETAREVVFVYNILNSIGIKVETPITVRVDNLGAIFLSKNTAISAQTRHIDNRLKCVKELTGKDNELIKVIFIGTLDNTSDIMTKNVKSELYTKHTKDMLGDKEKKN